MMPYGDMDFAPSHYLNQCWLIIKCVLWYTHENTSQEVITNLINDTCLEMRVLKQAVPINGDNIPPLWSVPTPSRNTQQIVLFLSDCGSYTGENHSRKICLRRISAWLCPLECHGMEGIEAAVDTKSLGNVKKRFRKKLRKPRFSVNFWPPEGQKWGHEHENR